ncbi:MAG: hypothetical protein JXN61_15605 [Sedimentisphaerales bacterium]|nr:hypothetical protein [Sedimentisphaerales bacterium]
MTKVKKLMTAGLLKNRFIRIMSRWLLQVSALELSEEKNRLGRGSNLGYLGGNLCLWAPERFFSVFRAAKYTYALSGCTEKPCN